MLKLKAAPFRIGCDFYFVVVNYEDEVEDEVKEGYKVYKVWVNPAGAYFKTTSFSHDHYKNIELIKRDLTSAEVLQLLEALHRSPPTMGTLDLIECVNRYYLT